MWYFREKPKVFTRRFWTGRNIMAFLPTYFLFPRAPGFIACTAAVSLTLVFSCKEAALEVTMKGGMQFFKTL